MTMRTLAAMALMSLIGLSACETVEGAGRDISSAGQAVTDTAQQAQ